MTYLDISPMLVALREQPSTFELRGAELHHLPSHHSFGFTRGGGTAVTRAWCDCAALPISEPQSAEFKGVFDAWVQSYWLPRLAAEAEARRVAKINRHFASHFRPNLAHRLRRWIADRRRPAAQPATPQMATPQMASDAPALVSS
jgi:hypothetical protein